MRETIEVPYRRVGGPHLSLICQDYFVLFYLLLKQGLQFINTCLPPMFWLLVSFSLTLKRGSFVPLMTAFGMFDEIKNRTYDYSTTTVED